MLREAKNSYLPVFTLMLKHDFELESFMHRLIRTCLDGLENTKSHKLWFVLNMKLF
jgi:hypothetical protein